MAFKKIKSLFHANPQGLSGSSPCQPFRANQTLFTAPICQITSSTVSVNTANWSTFGEGNDFCWGSISDYEYQLPIGWSISGNVSNGSNWISGGTSVVVTSDQTNGVNGVIRIRPINSCGTGLANNVPHAIIPVDRYWNGIYQVTLKSGKNVLQAKIIKQ